MTTIARIGYGSLFKVKSEGVYVTVGETKNLTPPGYAGDAVEATHMESPNGRREFVPGLGDEGETSFDINYEPGSEGMSLLRSLTRQVIECREEFPNGVIWDFDTIITEISPDAPLDDVMTATVTMKLTGDSDITGAAVPTNTVLPAISGLLTLGSILTAYPGVWTGAPVFTYQWKNAGSNIGGATNKTYAIQAGDSGDSLTVVVTGTNDEGSLAKTSAPVVAA